MNSRRVILPESFELNNLTDLFLAWKWYYFLTELNIVSIFSVGIIIYINLVLFPDSDMSPMPDFELFALHTTLMIIMGVELA